MVRELSGSHCWVMPTVRSWKLDLDCERVPAYQLGQRMLGNHENFACNTIVSGGSATRPVEVFGKDSCCFQEAGLQATKSTNVLTP